jgi:hypothetical protein
MDSAARVTKPYRLRVGKNGAIPPLRAGDRLSVQEFERRYEAMPDLNKAELIEGVVYMPSPVRMDYHGVNHFSFNGWLFYYSAYTPGARGADNTTVKLLLGLNQPQPDSFLCIANEYGGRCWTDELGYLNGAPELIGEVTASTASYDLHDKFHAYERNGVQEYVVWRIEDRAIDWFILHGGKFRRLALSKDGIHRSKVFPGLWLDAEAMIDGKLRRVLEVVQEGVASREHEAFVKKLQARRKK